MIANLPPLLEMSYDDHDSEDDRDDSSDLDGAEGKSPISLEQTEFSFKQFAKRMGQANYSVFNKCKKLWVAGFLEKNHVSIIRTQNHSEQDNVRHLYWGMMVAELWRYSRTGCQ